MAQAKTLQQNAPTHAGMFRHQAVPKERLSKMERKKRIMEAQTKEKEARLAKKGAPVAAKTKADGKRPEREEVLYKGTARQSRPSEPPAYRGTAGMATARGSHDRKRHGRRSRVDEYLGTDEEDEGEYGGYYEDGWSDASSDMEAGLDDVEQEEAAALRSARREDEEEQRREEEAKRAKLERQKKLAALVRNKR